MIHTYITVCCLQIIDIAQRTLSYLTCIFFALTIVICIVWLNSGQYSTNHHLTSAVSGNIAHGIVLPTRKKIQDHLPGSRTHGIVLPNRKKIQDHLSGSGTHQILRPIGNQLNDHTPSKRPLRIFFPTRDVPSNRSIQGKCILMYLTREPKTYLYHSLYNSSDVVIFKEGRFQDVLSYRPPGQRWVFYGREAVNRLLPPNTRFKRKTSANGFNYTMTYSVHSNLYMPYGKCKKVHSNPKTVSKDIDDIVKSRTKLVAWFVSHCQTASRRENYVRQLLNHVQVDVYGGCGNSSCPKETCKEETVLKQYKFYLAFENTLNGEYITEKVWRSLSYGLVPIVYGALDTYNMSLPSGSYIDVEDFKSPQALANYILKVSSDETLYRSFFSWKYSHKCDKNPRQNNYRAICDFLRSAGTNTVDLNEEWGYHSTRMENASLYLQRLGVIDVTPLEFNLTIG